MMQGINMDSLDPTIKGKSRLGNKEEVKPLEEELGKESFQKVFLKALDSKIESLEQENNGVFGENKLAPSAYKPKRLFEHIQLSDHPGRFAMMKNLDPENYEQGFEFFKQITSAEFDSDKLPKPGLNQLGMQNLINDIGLGVVG